MMKFLIVMMIIRFLFRLLDNVPDEKEEVEIGDADDRAEEILGLAQAPGAGGRPVFEGRQAQVEEGAEHG